MPGPLISKSRFLSGVQCHKLIWHHFHRPEDFPEPDASTQQIFDQGHEVGMLARSLFPKGTEIIRDRRSLSEILQDTQQAIKLGKPVYEAGFIHKNLLAYSDILAPGRGGKWDLIEVKSGTSVKDVNVWDVAFQSYVIEQSGLKIGKVQVMHLNSAYIRKGPINPKELFTLNDVTQEARALHPKVKKKIGELIDVHSEKKSPVIAIGPHCNDPYECPLQEKCWQKVGSDSVLNLVSCRKSWEWHSRGWTTLRTLPKNIYESLTDKQKIQFECTQSGKEHVNPTEIGQFLKGIQYPVYYLDFETFQTALPMYDGTSPWQQIPFQWSLHIYKQPGKRGEHKMFLAEGTGDPRKAFLESLVDELGDSGTILVYNASFEKSRLKECVSIFPKYKGWLENVRSRIIDLIVPFRSFHYYHPDQVGSASIKAVLPALIEDISYEDLEIGNGSLASSEFLRVTFGDVSQSQSMKVRKALEKYCKRDTEAMVWIHEKLMNMINGSQT